MTKALLVIIVLLVLALIGGGMWQKIKIDALVLANFNLTTERDTAKSSLAAKQTELDTTMVQVDSFIAQIAELEVERVKNRAEVDYVRDMFQDHDFANLLDKKPGLIEKRMIDATAAVLQELEDATK